MGKKLLVVIHVSYFVGRMENTTLVIIIIFDFDFDLFFILTTMMMIEDD